MDHEQVREDLATGRALLIDVREADERRAGHVTGSYHLPFKQLKALGVPDNLPNDKTLYVHCTAGVRAEMAAKWFQEHYENVISLDWGIDAFKERGFDVDAAT